jgi:CRP-like cAMP-binding protein
MTLLQNINTRNATSSSNSSIDDISNRLKYDKSDLLISQSSQPIFETAINEARQELSNEVIYRTDLFKKLKVFNHVDDEGMEILSRSVEVVYYKTNEYLIKQGDIGDALYVLEEGQVAVTRTDPDENGVNITRNIAVIGPHRLFGEVSLMTDEPRNASIYVVSDTAKCLLLTREKFQEGNKHYYHHDHD